MGFLKSFRVRLALLTSIVSGGCILLMVSSIIVAFVLEAKYLESKLPPEVLEELYELEDRLDREEEAGDIARFETESKLDALVAEYENDDTSSFFINTILVFSLVTLFFAIAVSFWFAGKVTNPIEKILKAGGKVVDGDLSVRVDQTSSIAGSEITKLVGNFNQLVSSLEKAEQRSRRDVAAVAHELRTPLTVLNGRILGMKDGIFDASPENHDRLLSQVSLLSRLVDDLRTISMANAGKLTLSREVIDLSTIAEKAVSNLTSSDLDDDIDLRSNLASVEIYADPDRLLQVISNLLTNAYRYAREGGVIEIRCGTTQERAFVEVNDNGPGLPDLDQVNLFHPFTRGETSRSRESGGSGLGLAIVSSIVKAHGGQITACTRSQGGASFRMEIPLITS